MYYSMSACKNGLGGYPEKCDRRFVDIYREDVKFRADFICAQREGSTKVRCVTEDAGMSPIAFSYDENAYSGIKENYPNITGVFKTILNQ
ncbi:MAG: hypothetical protein LBF15_02795 [Candidatus Peribacteria bacterium]|nr:hypothetical protein [Candidatus Peribacteria bacterium]